MKIQRIINSAIFATQDRRFVNKASKVNLDKVDSYLYESLKQTSGEPAKGFKESLVAWKKAYNSHMDRFELIDSLNKPFEKPSLISKIFSNKLK